MPFQNVINQQPGVAALGDFAGDAVRAVLIGNRNQMLAAAAPNQPYIGQFAWIDQISGIVYGNYQATLQSKIGFVGRKNPSVIIPFLQDNEMYVEAGVPVSNFFDQGTFWANLPLGATVGQKVFANFLTGSCYAANAGTSTQVASVTASIVGATGVMTVTVVGSGTLAPGDSIQGAGLVAPTSAIITSQLTATGAAGGGIGLLGTYATTYRGANVGSGTITANNAVETGYHVDTPAYVPAVFAGYISAAGVLTVTGTTSGTVTIGQTLQIVNSAGAPIASIPSNTTINSGSGPYNVTPIGNPVGSAAFPVNFIGSLGTLAIISTWG
jgi:hypothetical protein